jgi:hypothetical protein
VTSLKGAETTLRVRRYRRQPLAVDIVRNGKPLPGAVLWSDMALGTCGAGSGPLAATDSQGRIRLEAFYPEMWTNYWVCAANKPVWALPPKETLPARIDVGVTRSVDLNSLAHLCSQ